MIQLIIGFHLWILASHATSLPANLAKSDKTHFFLVQTVKEQESIEFKSNNNGDYFIEYKVNGILLGFKVVPMK